MLWRGFAIFENDTIFWSNYNIDLRSYGQLFVLVYKLFHSIHLHTSTLSCKLAKIKIHPTKITQFTI